jgi:putative transposase
MSKKLFICSTNHLYHVALRPYHKEPFPLPIKKIWELAKYSFKEVNEIYPINLVSFVLMNNHYHMLLYTPNGNLDWFIREFNKKLAFKIQIEAGIINQIFDDHYKWCLIQSAQYFSNCYRYVYQNPVRAGLVKLCEDYPFSTLQSLMGRSDFSIPVHDKFGFKDGHGLMWLNKIIHGQELDSLKKNLSRPFL